MREAMLRVELHDKSRLRERSGRNELLRLLRSQIWVMAQATAAPGTGEVRCDEPLRSCPTRKPENREDSPT